jgi:hypothetical protein
MGCCAGPHEALHRTTYLELKELGDTGKNAKVRGYLISRMRLHLP